MRKIAIYCSLISYLVPELQSFKGVKVKIKAKSMYTKQGNEINQTQSKLIKSVTSHTNLVVMYYTPAHLCKK